MVNRVATIQGILSLFQQMVRRLQLVLYQNDGNVYNSGHVRIYSWNGSGWSKLGADIDGEAVNDYSGRSVSLSADGQTVAIGAHENDGNGDRSGHVRIYSWTGSAWSKLGADIDGEATYDYSGHSVSLSADGQTVAIGAPDNDGNGYNSGHVRIYRLKLDSSVSLATDTAGLNVVPLNDWRFYLMLLPLLMKKCRSRSLLRPTMSTVEVLPMLSLVTRPMGLSVWLGTLPHIRQLPTSMAQTRLQSPSVTTTPQTQIQIPPPSLLQSPISITRHLRGGILCCQIRRATGCTVQALVLARAVRGIRRGCLLQKV